MKGILKFNLPEENQEFKEACNATGANLVLWNLEQKLRGYLKYGHKFKDADEAIETIREYLHEELSDYNISF